MLKINDIAIITSVYEHEDGHNAKEGDICIILDICEGGTEPWSGRDVDKSYKVLNESNGETMWLSWATSLRKYDKPYTRKTAEELQQARKQYYLNLFREMLEEHKEGELLSTKYGTVIKSYIEEIRELEDGYRNDKYTKTYFYTKMEELVRGLSHEKYDMNDVQLEFLNDLENKYL